MADLKPVYKAVTEEQALLALDNLEEKWCKKYPLAIKSWRVNWPELSTFFKYPPEIRKMIYTTNCIENYNRQLRKVTKTKSAFPSVFCIIKMAIVAKGIPHFCNYEIPKIAKAIAGTHKNLYPCC